MLLHLFLSPIVIAAPAYSTVKLHEQVDNSFRKHSDSDDDDLSLPSLGSTGSELSEFTCDEISKIELCHLLGPEIPEDKSKSVSLDGYKRPKNLQHSIKIPIPVGFRRLRKAFLSEDTEFWDEKVLSGSLKYKK